MTTWSLSLICTTQDNGDAHTRTTIPRRYQGILGTDFGTDQGDLFPLAMELVQQLDPDVVQTVSQASSPQSGLQSRSPIT